MTRHYEPEEVTTVEGFEVVRETEKAWILYFEELNEEIVLPKSQILAGDPEASSELEIPRWLADQKGLIEDDG